MEIEVNMALVGKCCLGSWRVGLSVKRRGGSRLVCANMGSEFMCIEAGPEHALVSISGALIHLYTLQLVFSDCYHVFQYVLGTLDEKR